MDKKELAAYIDHTNLKPEATASDIDQLCREAKKNGFAAVCVNPIYVSRCRDQLFDAAVKVCTVVGFPLGASTTKTKVSETIEAIQQGAQEIDMVISVGMLKSNQEAYVCEDVRAVVAAAGETAIVKVIIETCLLTDQQKRT
ncbi:MAG: deoxyribose-phosphate aldolase, partial [bacterium]|nr:deoxyribose-phosphate aldolase [bacterium]